MSNVTDTKVARQAVDLFVRLQESLRADGYGQDAIEKLTIEHLVALTHGDLHEPDGTVNLPASTGYTTEARTHVSTASLVLMDELLHALTKLVSLAPDQLVTGAVEGLAYKMYTEDMGNYG